MVKYRYLVLISSVLSLCISSTSQHVPHQDMDIPLTEDLMREHGVLNRVLLIYEEVIKRIDAGGPVPIEVLHQAVTIIHTFIEGYHEKLEEEYLFPLFEKNNKETKLIKTLRTQHQKGRAITAELQQLLAKNSTSLNRKAKKRIRVLLQKFITMYRPHEAREDTVLFPQVRSLLNEQQFDALSALFEDKEHEFFGKNGFEAVVKQVAMLEKELGIYDLERFTPH